MPIPDLDEDGFLPEGLHACSMDEIRERFGTFQGSDRRQALYKRLDEYVREAWSTGLLESVIVNGSFTTAKEDPNDIDLVLVLRADHDFSFQLRPFEYNVLSRRQVRKRFQFDILVARRDSVEYDEYVEFFQQVRGLPYRRKGVLKVSG
ncbi:MAG TPA: hypothetical protein VND64_26070 [Pirellulales bacterium]|nr:hypothetical protein [Pirellulales bacterium]